MQLREEAWGFQGAVVGGPRRHAGKVRKIGTREMIESSEKYFTNPSYHIINSLFSIILRQISFLFHLIFSNFF